MKNQSMKQSQQMQGYSYAVPHFIEELGEDGLTAHEIATSLGIPVAHVHQKMKRNPDMLDVHGWRAVTIVMANEITGLPFESHALNTRAAKAFVATYQNRVGRAYLDFLFNCEEIAMDMAKKQADAKSSKGKGKKLTKQGERRRRTFHASALDVLPGFPEDINWDLTYLKFLSEMTPLEIEAMRILKLTTIGRGIALAHTQAFADYGRQIAMSWLLTPTQPKQ